MFSGISISRLRDSCGECSSKVLTTAQQKEVELTRPGRETRQHVGNNKQINRRAIGQGTRRFLRSYDIT